MEANPRANRRYKGGTAKALLRMSSSMSRLASLLEWLAQEVPGLPEPDELEIRSTTTRCGWAQAFDRRWCRLTLHHAGNVEWSAYLRDGRGQRLDRLGWPMIQDGDDAGARRLAEVLRQYLSTLTEHTRQAGR